MILAECQQQQQLGQPVPTAFAATAGVITQPHGTTD